MNSAIGESSVNGGFHRWKPSAVLRVSGDDSASFLQGQFSNDLRAQPKKGAIYGLWLNHKGRVIADSFVRAIADNEFVVISYFCPAAVIHQRLDAFVIADDVVIEDVTAEWLGVTVLGDSERSETIATAMGHGALSFVGRRTRGDHREILVPCALEADLVSRLGRNHEVTPNEMETARLREGLPAVPEDIGPGELPNEGGLEAVAISYNKGCYLGQEVMARLKSMGQVRRRLLRVNGHGPMPAGPAEIFQGERRIGELRTRVRSSEGFEGLALLSLLNLQKNAGLGFSPNAEPVMNVVDNG